MKKSLLLIAAGLIAGFANGQDAQSSILFSSPQTHINFTHDPAGQRLSSEEMNRMHNTIMNFQRGSDRAARTTTTTISDWYNLWDQNYNNPPIGFDNPIGYYWATSPDSNLVDAAASPTYHMFMDGMGMSFDPTDSSYFSSIPNSGCLVSGNAVSQQMALTGQSYTIDSFYVPVQYFRNDAASVDSLIIELVVAIPGSSATTDTGAYNLQFTTASAGFADYANDEKPRFGDIHYNPGAPVTEPAPYMTAPYLNDCYFDSVLTSASIGTYKQRFALPLTAANYTDTTSGLLNLGQLHGDGVGLMALHINPVTLTSKMHMVSFVSFKSGHAGGTYPYGTLSTAANWIKLFAGSPRATGSGTSAVAMGFTQNSANSAANYSGSYQSTVAAQSELRYSDTAFMYNGKHEILFPGSDFVQPNLVVAEQSFHITWIADPTLGVNNVNSNTLDNVNAYPNPATSELNITYSSTVKVSVTLTNMLGQIVATQNATNGKAVFNTTELPSGLYIYTLQANGARTTGRVAISH